MFVGFTTLHGLALLVAACMFAVGIWRTVSAVISSGASVDSNGSMVDEDRFVSQSEESSIPVGNEDQGGVAENKDSELKRFEIYPLEVEEGEYARSLSRTDDRLLSALAANE